ncbi:methyltransferase [Sinomonas cellulolyticus]|uniref:Putative 4-hydroxy-4-methyl-2-oxoglutarate aldolase n=1 Tax=Sinomonas cellulolyticus TaxID=2801916 RepID=A0ABS1K6U5_9MICC|nr:MULTISPECIES: 4-hydroxy-4-methyl-2-oxoglutarate aldolase [Sinomonas]MBL0707178.1 dimethylmenaquinone methyltransferase [Sinomonas cellulolyticus]GHG49888.1 methyltransferase [Sinomonas sp. KCTC 49339]
MSIDNSAGHAGRTARAGALGAATLHEAAGRIGSLPSGIQAMSLTLPVAGRAFPVAVPPGDNLWLHHAIVAAAPGDVLVVSTGGAREFGYFGEVMAVAAVARGLGGLVIDGGVRDAQQMITLGFPVFADRRCIRGTIKDPRKAGSLGVPITIGDVQIEPGDLVVGDADGVVVIPDAQADDVVALGEKREATEAEYFARLRAGETTLGIYHLPTPAQVLATQAATLTKID